MVHRNKVAWRNTNVRKHYAGTLASGAFMIIEGVPTVTSNWRIGQILKSLALCVSNTLPENTLTAIATAGVIRTDVTGSIAKMEKPNRRRVASDRPAGAAKPTEDSLSRLRAIAQEMRTIPSQGKWYALTVLATKDGLANYSWYSEFSGFTKGSPRRELRQPSLVDPRKMADLWKSVGTPCVVVHNRVHLALYLRLGGTCLISREMAEYAFSKWMKPIEVGIVGAIQPSKSVSIASREELQHAPTPKLRTQILKRDDFRCLACGRHRLFTCYV